MTIFASFVDWKLNNWNNKKERQGLDHVKVDLVPIDNPKEASPNFDIDPL
jgi:hypothetical protein